MVDELMRELNDSPFYNFFTENLDKFEAHLVSIKQKDKTRVERMKGARQFAWFLLGKPASYGEHTKGTI
ncbi:MAG: hypothetical protein OXF97_07010 [Nitrospira sp.]|nr:hypothetical protein [Nitrospira sp.]